MLRVCLAEFRSFDIFNTYFTMYNIDAAYLARGTFLRDTVVKSSLQRKKNG